jgi:hypothetical protein
MKNLLAIAMASVASQTLAEAGPRLVQWQFERNDNSEGACPHVAQGVSPCR